jgi:uncharacterized protein (DUF433 family)
MDAVQVIETVAINPEIRNGRPYIVGTSVTVSDVVIAKLYHQQDTDGIADWYGLSLPQVYGALAYYYSHKDEIDGQIRTQIRQAESMKEQRVGSKTALLPG